MKLHVIFGQRQGRSGSAPEVIDCWDEFAVEDNPDGYEEAISKAKDSKEFANVIVIEVKINGAEVYKLLNKNPKLEGEILTPKS